MSGLSFKVVIPARYASTRLPGKPLLDLGGKPMVVRVAERARGDTLHVNRHEARQRGLTDGCRVRVASATDGLNMRLALSDAVPDGVALAFKSPWGDANINALNPGLKSDLGQSTAVHSVTVTVEPI